MTLDGLVEEAAFTGTCFREIRDHAEYDVSMDDGMSIGDQVHPAFSKKAVIVFARPESGIEGEIRLE